ncbi:hypothetical protein COBT_000272 [Conglomerata obtusa]
MPEDKGSDRPVSHAQKTVINRPIFGGKGMISMKKLMVRSQKTVKRYGENNNLENNDQININNNKDIYAGINMGLDKRGNSTLIASLLGEDSESGYLSQSDEISTSKKTTLVKDSNTKIESNNGSNSETEINDIFSGLGGEKKLENSESNVYSVLDVEENIFDLGNNFKPADKKINVDYAKLIALKRPRSSNDTINVVASDIINPDRPKTIKNIIFTPGMQMEYFSANGKKPRMAKKRKNMIKNEIKKPKVKKEKIKKNYVPKETEKLIMKCSGNKRTKKFTCLPKKKEGMNKNMKDETNKKNITKIQPVVIEETEEEKRAYLESNKEYFEEIHNFFDNSKTNKNNSTFTDSFGMRTTCENEEEENEDFDVLDVFPDLEDSIRRDIIANRVKVKKKDNKESLNTYENSVLNKDLFSIDVYKNENALSIVDNKDSVKIKNDDSPKKENMKKENLIQDLGKQNNVPNDFNKEDVDVDAILDEAFDELDEADRLKKEKRTKKRGSKEIKDNEENKNSKKHKKNGGNVENDKPYHAMSPEEKAIKTKEISDLIKRKSINNRINTANAFLGVNNVLLKYEMDAEQYETNIYQNDKPENDNLENDKLENGMLENDRPETYKNSFEKNLSKDIIDENFIRNHFYKQKEMEEFGRMNNIYSPSKKNTSQENNKLIYNFEAQKFTNETKNNNLSNNNILFNNIQENTNGKNIYNNENKGYLEFNHANYLSGGSSSHINNVFNNNKSFGIALQTAKIDNSFMQNNFYKDIHIMHKNNIIEPQQEQIYDNEEINRFKQTTHIFNNRYGERMVHNDVLHNNQCNKYEITDSLNLNNNIKNENNYNYKINKHIKNNFYSLAQKTNNMLEKNEITQNMQILPKNIYKNGVDEINSIYNVNQQNYIHDAVNDVNKEGFNQYSNHNYNYGTQKINLEQRGYNEIRNKQSGIAFMTPDYNKKFVSKVRSRSATNFTVNPLHGASYINACEENMNKANIEIRPELRDQVRYIQDTGVTNSPRTNHNFSNKMDHSNLGISNITNYTNNNQYNAQNYNMKPNNLNEKNVGKNEVHVSNGAKIRSLNSTPTAQNVHPRNMRDFTQISINEASGCANNRQNTFEHNNSQYDTTKYSANNESLLQKQTLYIKNQEDMRTPYFKKPLCNKEMQEKINNINNYGNSAGFNPTNGYQNDRDVQNNEQMQNTKYLQMNKNAYNQYLINNTQQVINNQNSLFRSNINVSPAQNSYYKQTNCNTEKNNRIYNQKFFNEHNSTNSRLPYNTLPSQKTMQYHNTNQLTNENIINNQNHIFNVRTSTNKCISNEGKAINNGTSNQTGQIDYINANYINNSLQQENNFKMNKIHSNFNVNKKEPIYYMKNCENYFDSVQSNRNSENKDHTNAYKRLNAQKNYTNSEITHKDCNGKNDVTYNTQFRYNDYSNNKYMQNHNHNSLQNTNMRQNSDSNTLQTNKYASPEQNNNMLYNNLQHKSHYNYSNISNKQFSHGKILEKMDNLQNNEVYKKSLVISPNFEGNYAINSHVARLENVKTNITNNKRNTSQEQDNILHHRKKSKNDVLQNQNLLIYNNNAPEKIWKPQSSADDKYLDDKNDQIGNINTKLGFNGSPMYFNTNNNQKIFKNPQLHSKILYNTNIQNNMIYNNETVNGEYYNNYTNQNQFTTANTLEMNGQIKITKIAENMYKSPTSLQNKIQNQTIKEVKRNELICNTLNNKSIHNEINQGIEEINNIQKKHISFNAYNNNEYIQRGDNEKNTNATQNYTSEKRDPSFVENYYTNVYSKQQILPSHNKSHISNIKKNNVVFGENRSTMPSSTYQSVNEKHRYVNHNEIINARSYAGRGFDKNKNLMNFNYNDRKFSLNQNIQDKFDKYNINNIYKDNVRVEELKSALPLENSKKIFFNSHVEVQEKKHLQYEKNFSNIYQLESHNTGQLEVQKSYETNKIENGEQINSYTHKNDINCRKEFDSYKDNALEVGGKSNFNSVTKNKFENNVDSPLFDAKSNCNEYYIQPSFANATEEYKFAKDDNKSVATCLTNEYNANFNDDLQSGTLKNNGTNFTMFKNLSNYNRNTIKINNMNQNSQTNNYPNINNEINYKNTTGFNDEKQMVASKQNLNINNEGYNRNNLDLNVVHNNSNHNEECSNSNFGSERYNLNNEQFGRNRQENNIMNNKQENDTRNVIQEFQNEKITTPGQFEKKQYWDKNIVINTCSKNILNTNHNNYDNLHKDECNDVSLQTKNNINTNQKEFIYDDAKNYENIKPLLRNNSYDKTVDSYEHLHLNNIDDKGLKKNNDLKVIDEHRNENYKSEFYNIQNDFNADKNESTSANDECINSKDIYTNITMDSNRDLVANLKYKNSVSTNSVDFDKNCDDINENEEDNLDYSDESNNKDIKNNTNIFTSNKFNDKIHIDINEQKHDNNIISQNNFIDDANECNDVDINEGEDTFNAKRILNNDSAKLLKNFINENGLKELCVTDDEKIAINKFYETDVNEIISKCIENNNKENKIKKIMFQQIGIENNIYFLTHEQIKEMVQEINKSNEDKKEKTDDCVFDYKKNGINWLVQKVTDKFEEKKKEDSSFKISYKEENEELELSENEEEIFYDDL